MTIHLFKPILASIALLILVSCGKPEATTPPVTSANTPPSPPIAASPEKLSSTLEKTGTTKTGANGFSLMQAVAAKTQAAVTAGNFDQAKTEFEQFESGWSKVEDGVKAKSPGIYDAIEEGMDEVGKGLKSKDKEGALKALASLTKSVTSAQ